MEARIICHGHKDMLWSIALIDTFIRAITCLLTGDETTKPTIQVLNDSKGINAFTANAHTTIVLCSRPHLECIETIVHHDVEFDPTAISLLMTGYFKATYVTHVKTRDEMLQEFIDDEKEADTRRMHIKVDSSPQWRLIESRYELDDVVVFEPITKTRD